MYDELIKSLRVEPFEVESVGLAKRLNEAADAIEELATKLATSCKNSCKWISVEEPPQETGRYLVRYLRDIDIDDGVHDDRIMIMRFLKNGGWRYPVICNEDVRQCVTLETVTHWQFLPEPPKEK